MLYKDKLNFIILLYIQHFSIDPPQILFDNELTFIILHQHIDGIVFLLVIK